MGRAGGSLGEYVSWQAERARNRLPSHSHNCAIDALREGCGGN